jgi:hypothetical protein
MVDYPSGSSDVNETLDKGLKALGLDSTSALKEYSSYLDASINGFRDSRSISKAIPCRRIWDGLGNRLALVLLFDSYT